MGLACGNPGEGTVCAAAISYGHQFMFHLFHFQRGTCEHTGVDTRGLRTCVHHIWHDVSEPTARSPGTQCLQEAPFPRNPGSTGHPWPFPDPPGSQELSSHSHPQAEGRVLCPSSLVGIGRVGGTHSLPCLPTPPQKGRGPCSGRSPWALKPQPFPRLNQLHPRPCLATG